MGAKRVGVCLALSVLGCSEHDPSSADPSVVVAHGPFADSGSSDAGGGTAPLGTMGIALPPGFEALRPAVPERSALPPFSAPIAAPPFGAVRVAARTPPPISGGTLASSASGRVIASDPDRDQLYVIDATLREVHTIPLSPGQEPGRIATHGERAYVALRAAGLLLTVDLTVPRVVASTSVCAAPRGVYFDVASPRVLVACAGGDVVSVSADGAQVLARTQVAPDLRDIGRDAQGVWVTQFRTASLLRLDANLRRLSGHRPGRVEAFLRNGALSEFAPTLAWRTISGPGETPLMLHQRAQSSAIDLSPAGAGLVRPHSPYGGGVITPQSPVFCQSGVVHTTLTRFEGPVQHAATPALPEAVVPVDVSAAPDGRLLAVVAPGNFVQDVSPLMGSPEVRQLFLLAPAELAPAASGRLDEENCLHAAPRREHSFPGEAVAVHFVDASTLVVQVRDPAELHVLRFDTHDQPRLAGVLPLASGTVRDTGHEIFHQNTSTGIACASCHGEALDDAHTWNFGAAGLRRTQHLRGGVVAHAPFHWSADLVDFPALIQDVYQTRMGARPLSHEAVTALAGWLTALPLIPSETRDTPAIVRGRALFESAEVGCATCHAGPALRSDKPQDVGSGGVFKVPSLRAAALRLPLMHTGCADTLEKRFDPACGGGAHGNTAQLSAEQISDLSAYLGSL